MDFKEYLPQAAVRKDIRSAESTYSKTREAEITLAAFRKEQNNRFTTFIRTAGAIGLQLHQKGVQPEVAVKTRRKGLFKAVYGKHNLIEGWPIVDYPIQSSAGSAHAGEDPLGPNISLFGQLTVTADGLYFYKGDASQARMLKRGVIGGLVSIDASLPTILPVSVTPTGNYTSATAKLRSPSAFVTASLRPEEELEMAQTYDFTEDLFNGLADLAVDYEGVVDLQQIDTEIPGYSYTPKRYAD
jgi:hypothetical protein